VLPLTISFYGEVMEIVGNKILIVDDEEAIFLDFGKSFKKYEEYYEMFQREPTSIEELLYLGIIPRIDGFYSTCLEELMKKYFYDFTSRKNYLETQIRYK